MRDIFDAYDEESKKEALDGNDQIDAAQLSAEIGGEEIAEEVRGATQGVAAEATLLQLQDNIVFVPEERMYIQKEWRSVTPKDTVVEADPVSPEAVFGPCADEKFHNTPHGGPRGTERKGDYPKPSNAKFPSNAQVLKADKQSKFQFMMDEDFMRDGMDLELKSRINMK